MAGSFLAVHLSTFLNTATTDEVLKQFGKQDSFRHIFKSSASMYESSGSHSLEPLLGYNQDQMPLTNQGNLGDTKILCSFRLVLEWKTGKGIPESSRIEFLEKFLANNCNIALSDAKGNTLSPLNRVGVADLPLLRTLLAICLNSRQPSIWKVIDSFVLLAYANLTASRTVLQ